MKITPLHPQGASTIFDFYVFFSTLFSSVSVKCEDNLEVHKICNEMTCLKVSITLLGLLKAISHLHVAYILCTVHDAAYF